MGPPPTGYNTPMAHQAPSEARWGRIRNRAGLISAATITRAARRIAERFQPDRVILFGSYAHGRPHRDSDVDLLVVMPARNEIDQSVGIWNALDPPFPLDVLVRTPKNLRWRLAEGDCFLQEVVSQGKVLYGKAVTNLVAGRRGLPARQRSWG